MTRKSRGGVAAPRWSRKDDALLASASAADITELARRLGRTRDACIQRRHTLGLPVMRDPPRPWTADEDETLADTARKLAEVAAAIGRTVQACALRAHRLGIVRPVQSSGLPVEELARRSQRRRRAERRAAGLCVVCGAAPAAPGIAACRPCQDRNSMPEWRQENPGAGTEYARGRRARDPNTGRGKRAWTAEEDGRLSDYSRTYAEIAMELGRSEASIICRAKRLGLPARARTAGKSTSQSGGREPVDP